MRTSPLAPTAAALPYKPAGTAPLVAGLLALLCAALLAATSPPLAAAEPSLATVAVERVAVADELLFDGRVEAVNRGTVSAQTSGRVAELAVDVDDAVEAGAVILRLVDIEQRAALGQAEAQLAEARARHTAAADERKRVADVYQRKLVSKAELDRADAAARAAKARVDAAEAALLRAEEQLGYTVIRAPYAGIVTRRHIEVGEMANPGTPLISGISLDELRVSMEVPQRLMGAVRAARRVQLIADGARLDAGELLFFPYADPASGSFRVRVGLDGARDSGLLPGMYVKVAVAHGEVQRLLIPAAAVLRRGELSAVYVVGDGGAVALRQLRLGPVSASAAGQRVEVLAGLAVGERIALDPVAAGIALKSRATAGGE